MREENEKRKSENDVPRQEELKITNKELIASIAAYFWILFFVPLIVCPESKFARFHANQGLCLLIFGIVTSLISGVIGAFAGLLPVFGIISTIVGSVLGIVNLLYLIYGIYNVILRRCKPLPYIGKFDLIK